MNRFVLFVPLLVLGSSLGAESTGKDLFAENCVFCHGTAGRGDGPKVGELSAPPPDLTKIAARRDGVWPMLELMSIIDGYSRNTFPREDMPVFENLLDNEMVEFDTGNGVIALALQDQVDPGLAETFSALKFDPLPTLDQGRTWRWAQGGSGQLVEFLTPACGDETIRDLPALGVNAQGLDYLNFLIAEPIHAAAIYRSGVLVQVPRSEKYAVHKLIIADRRRDKAGSLKSAKDREQSAFLIEAMAEDRPDDLARAYATALEVGPRWRERIGDSLKRMPETKAIIDSLGT